MSNIKQFRGRTRLDIPVSAVVENIDSDALDSILVLGWDNDDNIFMATSCGGDKLSDLIHLLEAAKLELLQDEVVEGGSD